MYVSCSASECACVCGFIGACVRVCTCMRGRRVECIRRLMYNKYKWEDMQKTEKEVQIPQEVREIRVSEKASEVFNRISRDLATAAGAVEAKSKKGVRIKEDGDDTKEEEEEADEDLVAHAFSKQFTASRVPGGKSAPPSRPASLEQTTEEAAPVTASVVVSPPTPDSPTQPSPRNPTGPAAEPPPPVPEPPPPAPEPPPPAREPEAAASGPPPAAAPTSSAAFMELLESHMETDID
eukprot:GHVU01133911.1.p1 GENE.GHVU01133911.1~~GHVU01133911.1.p1  ORF type:complete len:237 (+),score=43.35 GHVU01133911.1:932-1642(+)